MRVVVTGAGGLTGGAITIRLIALGHYVVAVAQHPVAIRGVHEVVTADCGDPVIMGPVLEGADALVHVAGITHGPRLARVHGLGDVPRLVVVSSTGAYSRHRASASAYLAGERALSEVNPRLVIVRPTMIYGSGRDRNIHHVIAFAHRFGFLPLVGRGDALLQPIHYDDLAAAVVALVPEVATGAIDAGGGHAISLREALAAVLDALGRPARLVPLPRFPALAFARVLDALKGSRWGERVERLTEDRSVENAVLVRLTGVRPRAFDVGVRDEVQAMRGAGMLA